MSQESNLQIYEMLTSLFVTVSKGEQIMDSIKQVLTTFDLFHPLALFKYLTRGNPILQPKHMLQFLQENNFSAKQEDIRIIFSFQGCKQKMNYSTFLNMIYPYSKMANREISSQHIKNYHATESLQPTQQVLACFFLLLTQQVQLINKIEVQKQDSLARVSKQKVGKVLRNIKKLTDNKSKAHGEKNPDIINALELVYFIKNFTTIQDSSLLYLLRRLGINHTGSIEIQKLEAFVKPWKKKEHKRFEEKPIQLQENPTSFQGQGELEQPARKRFNEQNYRKQLSSQLQRSISAKKQQTLTKRKTKRQGSIKIKQGQFCDIRQQQKPITKSFSQLNTPVKSPVKSARRKQKHQPSASKHPSATKQQSQSAKLFTKFITVFLKNSLEIQRLKQELNKGRHLNYLKIFKEMDSQERGIIRGEDLEQFYKEMGGVSVSINFHVLVQAFSQTSENWLSYSEFCEIFKPSIERSQKSSLAPSVPSFLSPDSQRLLFSQILYLTLLNEHELLQIRRQFTKQELFHLFSLINKEQTGFINYQELKFFLAEINFTQLSMYDLMLVLKRLDKCKNGVVSENQFVDYFLVKM